MKLLNLSASFLVGHVHFWGVAMRDKVFGSQRVRRLVRARSVEQAGIGYSLHSDFMVIDPNAWIPGASGTSRCSRPGWDGKQVFGA